jgi:hypothetical protein
MFVKISKPKTTLNNPIFVSQVTLLDVGEDGEIESMEEIYRIRRFYLKLFQRKLISVGCSYVDYSEFKKVLSKIKVLGELMKCFLWNLTFDAWSSLFEVRRLMFDVWNTSFDVWRLKFVDWCLTFEVRRLMVDCWCLTFEANFNCLLWVFGFWLWIMCDVFALIYCVLQKMA